MVLLLMAGGAWNVSRATDVTYHILTLPIDTSIYHLKEDFHGWRLEAVKVVEKGQSTLELPAQYKSPLATGFTYYRASDITKYNNGAVQSLFKNGPIKGVLYKVNGVDADTEGTSSAVGEGTMLSGANAEYYVVYQYKADTIAKLDGSVRYNIRTKYKDKNTWKDKGFMALNRGRNNRPALLPTANVDPEMLASEDFMKVSVDGTGVSPYWKDNNNNRNKEADVAGQFYFMFKFIGKDPYNILIRTAYTKDSTYIEKNDGTNDFVYKWYKEGSLFAVSPNNNCYIASDEHKKYNLIHNAGTYPTNPTNLEEGAGRGFIYRPGNYHGQTGVVWNTFALLNNSNNDGYVFMVTRTVDGNGAINNNIYYLKEKDNRNNLNFATGNSTDNLSIEGIYPIERVTFKVATSFYDSLSPTEHIISVPDWVSLYTVENDPIETKYLPEALNRKYCTFNGLFYKDAARKIPITHFSQATKHPTEGYQVYVGYSVSPSAPKFLSPSSSYTTATWYELTDEGSVQESGRKIKNNSGTYKNNGANGTYEKESEFAFVGDPYELKVLYRKDTEDEKANRYVTLSTYDTWDMPDDKTVGSFLLRKYNDTGYWRWDAGQASVAVTYPNEGSASVDKDAHTVTINLTGLYGSKYYNITTGGTGAGQIVSVTPEVDNVTKETGSALTVVVSLAANTSGEEKTMTVSIQEYNDAEGNTPVETPANPSVITITQGTGTTAFAGNEVTYNTDNPPTRVKVLTLPTRTYTYNMVDRSGSIAVKASTKQTIFSALSLASVPSIIVSPLISDERVTFYDSYTDRNGDSKRTRLDFHYDTEGSSEQDSILETPNTDHDIFVTYTTVKLSNKPINISENQEFNVVLNGHYLWYDSVGNAVKTAEAPSTGDLKKKVYLWKLRNRDPYAMLIDNLGAREDSDFKVADEWETVTVYDDRGTETTDSRQKGAWVDLASIANGVPIIFTKPRAEAQPFVAKASVQTGVYEVMVATGTSVDASTTYYNIGSPSENTVQIYYNDVENGGYAHGNDVLKFHLEQSTPYTYYLIDKAKHKLLTLTSQNPDLTLPADYQSPLATYKYYAANNIRIADKGTPAKSDDEYTPIDTAATLGTLADLEVAYTGPTLCGPGEWEGKEAPYQKTATDETDMLSQVRLLELAEEYVFRLGEVGSYTYQKVNVTRGYRGRAIYVTYTKIDSIPFGTGHPYTLKFLEPFAEGYFLEDGADKLTTNKIKAVYPYCNGDGNLNVYGAEMQTEQFGGGASTRPRWIWYFDSENDDPYHVRIRSRSTISYNSVSYPTYLTTYAVRFNQDTKDTLRVVTGGTLPGVASVEPTEYMIVGSLGAFKLMTTDSIDDGVTKERRKVTSLEQYWKTYNMLKLDVLGLSATTDNFEGPWEVPTVDDPETAGEDESTYRTIIEAKGWHSYDAYANATRWNGFNDKSDGHEKKVVEKLEHWFQTFNMGNGTFQIESANIPPVLVLLDLHGWEIMRLPLPTVDYPNGDDELAALRAYDSPLVKEYKFYSQATKASGCHKYTLRLDDKTKAERDQIKVGGVHYTSPSLGDLPPITASGVKSSGAFNDQFVTYTVKEEFAKSCTYSVELNEEDTTYSETLTASKFLVLLRSRFLRDNGSAPGSSYNSKPIYEASQPVGGSAYDAILDPQQVTQSNVSTAVDANPQDGKIDDINLWYLQPNLDIDKEMGIKWGTSIDTTKAEPLSEFGTKKKYYNRSGFDPYNIQLRNAANDKFLTAHQTSTRLDNGILIGDYSGVGGTTDITLETKVSYDGVDPMDPTGSVGYDHTNLKISNQTFMAVSDASGNMQLMPRFDHTKRVNLVNNSQNSYTTLQNPVNHPKASATDNSSMGTQTVFFVRPQVFEYRIIDNDGQESLRYKRSGDYYPAITDHFMSPIATNFTYYKGLAVHGDTTGCTVQEWARAGKYQRSLTAESMMLDALNLLPDTGTYYYRIGTRGQFIYRKVTVSKGLLEQQITGSFAAAGLNGDDNNVIVRYEYNAGHDLESDKILQGKWFTVKLANKDLQASGTVVAATDERQGTGVDLYAGDKTGASPINGALEKRKWQWKFVATLADPASDYYEEPDPYAVHIFNRQANYTNDPSTEPNPMNAGIKVPNANDGADRFALLSHSEGGYALAKAGTQTYNYEFVNGAYMTAPNAGVPVAATIVEETGFTQKAGIFSGVGSLLLVEDDVEHNFTYKVINNGGANYVVDNPGDLAVEATQDNDEADAHQFSPYLPESAQTPLLRDKVDYKYYGFAIPAGPKYKVIPQTVLYTLYGLYDDVVWVRYNAYNMDSTEFKVPNDKAIVGGHVARGEDSHDVSMNIEGALPYNIIWYDDNMMSTNEGDTEIIDEVVDHDLDGDHKYVWYFEGNDPYALRIKHKLTGGYVDGSTALTDSAGAKLFMLLKKDGHEYGILQVTGTTGEDAGKKLTGFGGALTGDAITDPTKFVIFGLSVHDLIYRLIIAKTCTKEEESNPDLDPSKYVDIPYRAIESGDLTELRVFGSTQRDLESYKDPSDPKRVVGDKYQLGDTVRWGGAVHTYSHDAGAVSIGDVLEVPNVFNRPNCTFEYYIEGIYNTAGTTPEATLNSKYKGLKVDKLMPSSDLIDKTVVVNIVYSFNKDLATNAGLDFVRDVDQNLWYTFETQGGSKPYLAHYTNAWGMQSMEGRETRYTNDYLWTPLGDVYGFKMYNRYMIKNSGADDKVMTYAGDASAGKRLVVAKPGDDADVGTYTAGNEIFELLKGDADGYFRVHPVVNTGETKYYVVRNADADNYTELSSSVSPSSSDWTFGLDMALLEPYYVRAGYVGGLTATAKAAYKAEIDKGEGKYKITDLQNIVYADSNIVSFSKGYYRLHSVPGTPGISPVRYASGYLHEIERDQNGDDDEADAIPMHFYSKAGVTGTFDGDVNPLRSGFTETHATRGDIPVPATEDDPSTIFYLDGAIDTEDRLDSVNPRVIMSTQGLYVKGKVGKKVVDEVEEDDPDHGNVVMTATQGEATKFSLIDIGGAVLLITNELAPATRNYMHYGQEAPIYDLKYCHNSPTNEARWCVEPANNQGLEIATNNGGDGYYYTTFYAPFDVLLPADADGHTYNAYTCNTWHDKGVHPTPVPANTYSEGKFIPAQTPVIIRTNDESGSVTMTLPSTEPSAPISSCVFTGKYLEQMLPLDAGNQWQYDVYTLGLPMTSDVEKDKEDYNSTGDITAPLAEFDDAGVGFYINATPNKEHDALKSMWLRNNRYVLHNKIYFRATGGGGGGAPDHTRGTEFVPVLFDDEGGEDEPGSQDENGNNRRTGDGCVYDLLGRKVAAAAEVKAGTCYLSPGIYIIDGKKVFVGVGR